MRRPAQVFNLDETGLTLGRDIVCQNNPVLFQRLDSVRHTGNVVLLIYIEFHLSFLSMQ